MSKLSCDFIFSRVLSVKEFVFVAFVLTVVFTVAYLKLIKRSRVGDTGLVLLLLGSLGNMYERLSLSCVNDYLSFFGLFRFNVQDFAITVGIFLILISIWKAR